MDNYGETNGDYKYVTLISCKNNKLKIMRKQEWKQKRKKEHKFKVAFKNLHLLF
jgi:hypothetical protein